MTHYRYEAPWIQTMRGRAVSLMEPTPDDIDPVELAILAGRLHRFGGHTLLPYTVAEHQWRVSRICPLALAGLLHDAHECYLGCDLTRPMKLMIANHTPVIALVEDAWDRAIAERFGFDPDLFQTAAVKLADSQLLATEKRDLMAPEPKPWAPLPEALPDRITPFREPAVVFAKRLAELTGEAIDLEDIRRNTTEPRHSLAGAGATAYVAPQEYFRASGNQGRGGIGPVKT